MIQSKRSLKKAVKSARKAVDRLYREEFIQVEELNELEDAYCNAVRDLKCYRV